MDYFKLITMFLIYINTYKYMSNYSHDTSFDNIYIDNNFIKFDAKSEKTVFPLNKRDTTKYVVMSQRRMLQQEK